MGFRNRLRIRSLAFLWVAGALAGAPTLPPTEEASLIAVIQADGASLQERGVACRRLAAMGSRQAIPPLAALLDHPQLAHLACHGLEAMPYPEANDALREALDLLKGRYLVGVINTLGVRRDAGAVPRLERCLTSNDLEVAEAAAAALGHVGTSASARILERALTQASAQRRGYLADASLNCGDRLLSAGEWNAARRVFDGVVAAEVPNHLQVAALRGSILARRDGGIGLLLEQIESGDEQRKLLGMRVAREIPGVRATRALARLLPDLPTERQALLVTALGDRGDPAALDAVLGLARQGAIEARVAALRALIRLPAGPVIPALLQAGLDPERRVSRTAESALVDMPEGSTDRRLAAQLGGSDQATRHLIIAVLARRRAAEAQDVLLKLTAHEDPSTREAALRALGNVLTPAGWPTLVACLVQAPTPAERTAADAALEAACARFDDKLACVGPLATALPAANEETRALLLRRLGQVGGQMALQAVREYTAAGTPQAVQDTAIRVIAAWPDVEALPDLQALLESAEAARPHYRMLAFEGFVRLARDSALPAPERQQLLTSAMGWCADNREKRLVLAALGTVASPGALDVAKVCLTEPDLTPEACSAVLRICAALNPMPHRSAMEDALKAVLKTAGNSAASNQARQRLTELGAP